MSISRRPGGAMASRPLHFIWLLDCSGSMDGEKIKQLNFAIRESIPHMKDVADDNPFAQILIRAVTFNDGARWHIASPLPIDQFKWRDVIAENVTDLGSALHLVAKELDLTSMPDRALPPVLVLVSDGQPTDDWKSGYRELMAKPWGQKSIRVAIAVGQDADRSVLQHFIGNTEVKPLEANNPEALVRQIRFVSTEVLKAASAPASTINSGQGGTPIPVARAPIGMQGDPSDVW